MTTKSERMAGACGVPQGVSFPVRRATVTSAEVWEIPTEWKGKYVTFRTHGAAGVAGQIVYIRFGTSASVAVSASAVSTLTTNTLTANASANEPHVIVPADGREDELIDSSWTHLAHISGATTGFIVAALRTADES